MRVLVTRPQPGAGETAARLTALGHEALVLPLTRLRTLGVLELPDAEGLDAVAVTSASAVRHAPPALIAALSAKRCFAVGRRTAEACTAAGFASVRSAEGDGAALVAMLAGKLGAAARLAYLCGRVRRPEFEAMLARAGISVRPIETYDTVPQHWPIESVRENLDGRPVDAVLLYSQSGAAALFALAADPRIAPLFAAARFCCLSSRVAEALGALAPASIAVSPEPNDAALISLLAPHPAAKSFP